MRFLWGWLTVSAVSSTCLAAADFDRTLFERTSDTTTRRLDQPGGLTCFDSLIFSDVDFDRKVTKTEYITFLELFGPDNFLPEGTDTFDDLPLYVIKNVIYCQSLRSVPHYFCLSALFPQSLEIQLFDSRLSLSATTRSRP